MSICFALASGKTSFGVVFQTSRNQIATKEYPSGRADIHPLTLCFCLRFALSPVFTLLGYHVFAEFTRISLVRLSFDPTSIFEETSGTSAHNLCWNTYKLTNPQMLFCSCETTHWNRQPHESLGAALYRSFFSPSQKLSQMASLSSFTVCNHPCVFFSFLYDS